MEDCATIKLVENWLIRWCVQISEITRMDEKTIWIIPYTGEKWWTWSGKFMERAGIKVYYVLLTGDKKISADDAGETK